MKPNAERATHLTSRKVVSWVLVLTLFLTMFNVGAIAQEVLSLDYGTPAAGSSLKISWNAMEDADHYEYSVRNTTTGDPIYDHETTTKKSFTIPGKYLIANNSYRVWVGAYRPEDTEGWPPATHTAQWEFTVPEVEYDDLVVEIEDPGEVAPGDKLIVRSSVSGGSGDYSYLWTWTHPDGTELTDTRKNCSILGSVLGTYTFTLTVTDNETGISQTSDKLTVEVKAAEEEYDPMEISFVGGEDEVEIELAMVGIAAECSVSGGSGNFEYAWNIERDGVTLQSYSYGIGEEHCEWQADKVGVYTFRVTVKDLETGLTKSASRSITVVQKEYDPLTLEITSAPTYADVGETVRVSAETTGGVGDVATSWEVYLGNNCVASGNGLTAQFVPSSDGKYTVIMYAEDEAQELEDRVTITAGSLVKCDLSVSCNSLYAGGEVTAQVTVQDGIGPFSYEWMVYLNDTFVSSDLDSESTTYSWNAAQAGTYRVECTVYDLGKEELVGEMVWATDSAEVVAIPNAVISGAFGEDNYTLAVGETLDVAVSASAENASLTRVTVTVDGSGDDSHDSEDVSGSSWNGYLTLDGNVYPLNTPGTYTIKLFAKVDAGNPDWAEVDRATLIVTAAYEEPEKLADPVVAVTIDGTTMTATWDAVEGAERYVYSLRNLTDDDLIAEHIETNGCSIFLNLEAGKQYNLAVGAVPAGITDTIANKTLLSWDEAAFEIAAEDEEPEKLADPVVTVKVNGTTMTATWDAVEGAERYVYSLRNLTDDKLIAEHIETNGCTISLPLEAGKQYNLAVGAVPAGITDTIANKTLLSWDEVAFEIAAEEAPEKLANPVVTVKVDGTTMTATWDAVDGADRYVYSLRNLTDDQRIAFHENASNRSITSNLETGKQYKLAVAAVPADVKDTEAEAAKCSWTEVVFNVGTVEEPAMPVVLSVTSDMTGKTIRPGEKVTYTITCNSSTMRLDVYNSDYSTLYDPYIDEDNNSCFEYEAMFSANGKYKLQFVALDAQDKWSDKEEDQGIVEIVVCDHSASPVLINTSKPVNYNGLEHLVTLTYCKTCFCGSIDEEYPEEALVAHEKNPNTMSYEADHTPGFGHRKFYKCSCGAHPYSGDANPTKDDYYPYVEALAKSNKCSVCRTEYEKRLLIKELQTLLNNKGYNAGIVDGLWGPNTKNAMNAFRADVMKLSAIEYVDEATMQALRNGLAADVVPEEKVDQEEVKPAVDEATLRAEYEDAQSDYKYASKDVTNSYLVSGTVSQIAKQNDALGGFSGTIKAIYAGTYKVIDQGVEVLEDSNAKYEDYVYDMVYNATLASLSGMTQGFGDTSNSTKTIETWKEIVDSADQLGGLTDSAMEIMLKDLWEYAGQSVADNEFSYKYGKWGINSVLDIFQKRQAAQEEVLHYFNIVQNRIYYAEVLDSVKTQAKNEGNAVLVEVCSDILSEIDKEIANIKVDIGLTKTGEWIHDTTTDFVYDATNQLISNAISSANPGWWFVEAAHFVGELANTSGKIEEQENIIVIEALMDSMKDSKNNAARSYAETDNELFYLCMTGMLHEVGLQSVETIYGGFQWTDVFNLTDAAGTVKNAQAQQREISEALNSAVEAYYQMQDSAYDSVR